MSERVLLTGATGFLGGYLAAALRRRGVDFVTAGRRGCEVALELADPDSIREAVRASGAAAVLNAAAMSRMGDCAADPERAHRVNGAAVGAFAAAGVRVLQVSTDLVFDGTSAPYRAVDAVSPLSPYGASKVAGERALLAAGGGLVVRVPLLFGPSANGTSGATDMLRAALAAGSPLRLFADEFRTPLHAADAARALVALVLDRGRCGVVHVAGPERVSRWQLAERFCAAVGVGVPASWAAVECEDEARPRDVSLAGDEVAGFEARSLDAALAAC